MTQEISTHPVQRGYDSQFHGKPACAPQVVTLRAYEVYCKIYGKQEALVTGGCRGGFGVGELVAFLYAHSFPENEWRMRFDEAVNGLNL